MFKPLLMPRALISILAIVGVIASCDKSGDHTEQGDQTVQEDHAVATVRAPQSGPIAIAVNEKGYQPSRVEVKQGDAVTLRFTRTTDETCATEVVFPELGVNKPLPLNQPVDIEIPAKTARTLTFQCGMGMYKSQVVIN